MHRAAAAGSITAVHHELAGRLATKHNGILITKSVLIGLCQCVSLPGALSRSVTSKTRTTDLPAAASLWGGGRPRGVLQPVTLQ